MTEEKNSEAGKNPALDEQVMEVLQTTYDPEIPVNVYDLGLIYEKKIKPDQSVYIKMTVTSPNCPAIEHLPNEIRSRIMQLEGVTDCFVEITFDPPWSQEMMTDVARLQLGFM